MMKKGQAALEFLITYGWAIVIIVGIVSTLFFMGMQDPERYVSSRCLFEDSFVCADFGFESDSDRVVVELSNIIGAPIELMRIQTTVDGDTLCDFRHARASANYTGLSPGSSISDFEVGAGDTFFIEIYCSPALSLGDDRSVALDVDIQYQIQREGYFPKTSTGKIVGRT